MRLTHALITAAVIVITVASHLRAQIAPPIRIERQISYLQTSNNGLADDQPAVRVSVLFVDGPPSAATVVRATVASRELKLERTTDSPVSVFGFPLDFDLKTGTTSLGLSFPSTGVVYSGTIRFQTNAEVLSATTEGQVEVSISDTTSTKTYAVALARPPLFSPWVLQTSTRCRRGTERNWT